MQPDIAQHAMNVCIYRSSERAINQSINQRFSQHKVPVGHYERHASIERACNDLVRVDLTGGDERWWRCSGWNQHRHTPSPPFSEMGSDPFENIPLLSFGISLDGMCTEVPARTFPAALGGSSFSFAG